jgi:hypothetical protein
MANRVVVRFYAELDDFLPPGRRQRDLDYEFGASPPVKDVIEALGVPLAEVDVILVNGEPVDLSYRIENGDRIAVYPVFETFDVTGVGRLRPEPLREVRFVVDATLGPLARNLRLLGFDTAYGTDWPDELLVRLSVEEHRVLLTRDPGLLARPEITHGLLIRDQDPRDQLDDVVRRLQLAGPKPRGGRSAGPSG